MNLLPLPSALAGAVLSLLVGAERFVRSLSIRELDEPVPARDTVDVPREALQAECVEILFAQHIRN